MTHFPALDFWICREMGFRGSLSVSPAPIHGVPVSYLWNPRPHFPPQSCRMRDMLPGQDISTTGHMAGKMTSGQPS
ncbi:hypothetical protein BGC31_08860 [Komagataeibacter xylinus]|nr:hypothetical protein BGC31_08860 [Komagataeibacter xylinus]RFP07833.1 hypothetical protein BFX83_05125 [Komagataeibacter xylinus]